MTAEAKKQRSSSPGSQWAKILRPRPSMACLLSATLVSIGGEGLKRGTGRSRIRPWHSRDWGKNLFFRGIFGDPITTVEKARTAR